MAKNKYYAVKKGHETGIFDNWEDCQKQIHGYSAAIFKSFKTIEEAQAYLEGQEAKDSQVHLSENDVLNNLDCNEIVAYVDGSNTGDGSAYSWGIVTFSKKLGKKTFNGMDTNPKFLQYRNIAGELFAAVKATQFALDNQFTKITIYHDYSGIRHWALKEWKCKNELTKTYQAYFENVMRTIKVEFVKVEGHTGDKFNEEADKLAKKALDIK